MLSSTKQASKLTFMCFETSVNCWTPEFIDFGAKPSPCMQLEVHIGQFAEVKVFTVFERWGWTTDVLQVASLWDGVSSQEHSHARFSHREAKLNSDSTLGAWGILGTDS